MALENLNAELNGILQLGPMLICIFKISHVDAISHYVLNLENVSRLLGRFVKNGN